MKLNYLLLDVFTTEGLQGNPLAVVLRADGLLDNQMQAVAREFNLSETVFLTAPKSERHTAAVRIFTPEVELGFAGHPTVGAAVVLALQQRVSAVRIEESVGMITCIINRIDKKVSEARFALPHLPEAMGKVPDRAEIALALGIDLGDIGCGVYQPAAYSAGTHFYLVPVRNAVVLKKLRLERRGWQDVFPLGHHSVYVFTETPEEPANDFAARMFSPGMGLGEDPGTGSAAAALIGLIGKHAEFDDAQREFSLRQGLEINRLCRISIQVRMAGGELVYGGIGGHAIIVGEGTLEVAH